MESFSRLWRVPMPQRSQQKPQPRLFGENGVGTTKDRASIEAALSKICTLPGSDALGKIRQPKTEIFLHVREFLEMLSTYDSRLHQWSLRPRLYALLNAIGALDYMEDFVRNDIYDISLPYDFQTLPGFLTDDIVRTQFLAKQASVLTDARRLESSSEDHMYFDGSAEDHLTKHRDLGHGGFGYVDHVISRLSAKSYARKRVHRGKDSEENRRSQKYLVDEIRLMKPLRHGHLTKIIQSYSDTKYIGFLMEPIADCNLKQFLARAPFPEDELIVLRQFYGCLASGVDYLHQQRIRHRDLKLENVLVKNSRIFIADFGTALSWRGSNRGTTQSRGGPVTPEYMAPEAINRQPRNMASDMWSLGLVFLEILTILKGQSLSKWHDHLKKKAERSNNESWPCQNLPAVHEWMAILAETQRHESTDDQGLAWRDNEPLVWIKSLLEHNPEARLSSKALVTTIADSIYLRTFTCPDCAEEFLDPQYRYNDGQEWCGASRDVIDAEVTALFDVVAEPTEQMDEHKTELVTRWLGQTQEEHPFHDGQEPDLFAMPVSLTGWSSNVAAENHAQSEGFQQSVVTETSSRKMLNGSLSSSREAFHDAGFFVDHEEDSSDAESLGAKPDEAAPDGLFPIVHEASSESSEEPEPLDRVGSGMLDQILEEVDEPVTPELLSSLHEKSDPTSFGLHNQNEPVDRFEGPTQLGAQCTGAMIAAPDTEMHNAEHACPQGSIPTRRKSPGATHLRRTKSKRLDEPDQNIALRTGVVESKGSNKPIAEPPHGRSSCDRNGGKPGEKSDARSDILPKPQSQPRMSNRDTGIIETQGLRCEEEGAAGASQATPTQVLPSPEVDAKDKKERYTKCRQYANAAAEDPKTSSKKSPFVHTLSSQAPLKVSGHKQVSFEATEGVSEKHRTKRREERRVEDHHHKPTENPSAPESHNPNFSATHRLQEQSAVLSNSSVVPDDVSKSSSSKILSAGNVGRFNRGNKAKSKPKRRSFTDDKSPAESIEAAWLAAEVADSLATSAMSSSISTKLRGIKLLWDDKAYSHLERYSRAGKSVAVSFLLEQGCNCGTILKPRPKPLALAIEGGSARHNKCVRALIKAGTNVNAKHRGKTHIHCVFEQGYFHGYQKLLAMLLAAGAEMNVPDATGEYPLTKLFKGAPDVQFEDYQKDCLALVFHAKVPCEVNPSVRQPFTEDTPLHQAVRRRTAQAVALLIHKGADINAKNASGTTPLLMAANQWREELTDQQERMLRYLLDAKGLDLNATGGVLGRTALQHAAAASCGVALDMLIESGAQVGFLDKEGRDALAILEASWSGDKASEDYQVMREMLINEFSV